MLNIAPLDYERYAALYSPPPAVQMENAEAFIPNKTIQEASPVSPEMRRSGTNFRYKTGISQSVAGDSIQVNKVRETDHPLNGPLPTDVGAILALSDFIQNQSPVQLGLTPEKVTGLYQHQFNSANGTLRIVA